MQQDQGDIDALLLEQEQDEDGASTEAGSMLEQASHTQTALGEDSPETAESQQEASIKKEGNSLPKGKPWVDFAPPYTPKTYEHTHERLAFSIDRDSDHLRDKELLKLSYLGGHVHKAYYRLWVRHSNALFRALIRMEYRKESCKKKKKLKEI